MTHMRVKLLVAGVVFVSAISYLAFAGAKKGWVYTVAVDSYLTNPELRTQRVRLCGKAAAENLTINSVGLSAAFDLCGQTQRLPVVYHGVVPDLFKPGCEVVVEGKEAQGVFQADVMMTKCASKYEEERKAKTNQGRS